MPLSFHADGAWNWTVTVAFTYDLRVHGIRPDTNLYHRIAAHGHHSGDGDPVTARHALDGLRRSSGPPARRREDRREIRQPTSGAA